MSKKNMYIQKANLVEAVQFNSNSNPKTWPAWLRDARAQLAGTNGSLERITGTVHTSWCIRDKGMRLRVPDNGYLVRFSDGSIQPFTEDAFNNMFDGV